MPNAAAPEPIALIGRGAIARWLTDRLEVPIHSIGRGDPLPRVPLVVEAAGHGAVAEHGPAALMAGSDLLLASVGALADTALHERITDALGRPGAGRLILPAGALAGVDALAAARLGGLDEVVYTARKPASTLLPDRTVTAETVVLEGTARQAALAFPKSSNVAATVALAGLGLDATRVRIVADPAAQRNIHTIAARGTFGSFEMSIAGHPLPDNPRSSMLTAMSLMRAILNRHARIVV